MKVIRSFDKGLEINVMDNGTIEIHMEEESYWIESKAELDEFEKAIALSKKIRKEL